MGRRTGREFGELVVRVVGVRVGFGFLAATVWVVILRHCEM